MWIELLSEFDGRKVGEVYDAPDSEASVLLKTKSAKSSVKPKVVADAENADADTSISEFVSRTAKELVGGLRDAMHAEAKSVNGRSTIVVGRDNELDDPTDGFRRPLDFYKAVHKACSGGGRDERLVRRVKATGASEDVNSDGGYATPVEYATTIFNDIIAQDSLMNQCFTMPMESNSIKLPALNYTQQGQFGVTAQWEGEGKPTTTSKANYRQPQLTLSRLSVLTPVTSELLEDGIAVESTINFLASEALTYKINDAIIGGTGAGQPTGVVGHASTASVARNTALSVKAQDILAMDSVFNGSDDRAVWLISKADVQPQLLTIADGSGRYLYFAPGTFGETKGPANMLGRRVRPLINCKTLGTAGDIILWDPKSYVFGYKTTGIQKAMSIHLYFDTNEVAYRWTFRGDGRPWRDTTLKAAGSNSLAYGSAVTLSTKLS